MFQLMPSSFVGHHVSRNKLQGTWKTDSVALAQMNTWSCFRHASVESFNYITSVCARACGVCGCTCEAHLCIGSSTGIVISGQEAKTGLVKLAKRKTRKQMYLHKPEHSNLMTLVGGYILAAWDMNYKRLYACGCMKEKERERETRGGLATIAHLHEWCVNWSPCRQCRQKS